MPTHFRLALPLAAALAVPGLTVAPAPVATAATPCDALTQPIHRVVHGTTQNSLTTPWRSEADGAVKYGFGPAQVIGKAANTPAAGLVAVHRLWRAGDFVTAPASDVASWTERGYTDQGVRYHAAPNWASCGTAVHRLVKAGVHREVLAGEVPALTAQGWSDAGAKFRLAGAPDPAPAPAPVPAPAPAPAQTVPSNEADADGRFSLAVIPDTQNETLRAGAPRLVARNNWLVQQRQQLDLRAALQVGDLANWDTPEHEQYVNGAHGMKVLEDAGIPWVGAVGNHDSYATGQGGSARPGVNVHEALRDTATYNRYLDGSHFRLRTATESGREDNSVHDFTAGGLKWSVVVLELWPRADKLAWAKQQVAARADRNVIVLTHDYLTGSGAISTSNGGYGDLPVSAIRDQLVAPNPNVKIVLSGHQGVGAARVDDYTGHRVVSLQQNYDNLTDALVRLVEVDVNANTIKHTYRSANTDRVVSGETVVDRMGWVR